MTTTKLIEVEDDEGNILMGVVERLTEKGEMVIRLLGTDKVLVFRPPPIKESIR